MKLNKYEKFTDDLKEKLLNYNQVTGLVAVGSMSKKDHLPDEWSDHDFFVIVKSGYQKYFRENLSWLPDFENILLSFQETEHGLKVFYNNGHLIEFAIFDQEELFLAKINSYRILIDKANIKKNIEKMVNCKLQCTVFLIFLK
ncbi:nucleotidyltransferase-like protein [Halanaerobium saccharolyticum]|uniref:Nucleotidyltransferase-like protein n=1 Tax=Halanaerobium saccharolyticum TaxID=43595 RepID=A0A2T5RPK8_9FIRM|nr:nucleotidyltransferase domain-containing protein [Halanaerobium saccharolyticum]PTW01764.1 nucleotidyltransferase-like protein [Halanaerobium saccharolyticum]